MHRGIFGDESQLRAYYFLYIQKLDESKTNNEKCRDIEVRYLMNEFFVLANVINHVTTLMNVNYKNMVVNKEHRLLRIRSDADVDQSA